MTYFKGETMFKKNLTGFTTLMIYAGTLLLSVLSFFTTYFGMKILLNDTLALIGTLGLQIAMLGIAWNLMKIKENRFTYISVFCLAASFSIFFSFANFDTNLKENTRVNSARKNYTESARGVIADYTKTSRDAALKGRYQIDRLHALMTLEKTKGWATVVDEGSGDKFLQEFLDGARATVTSWENTQGKKYSHGSGEGIVFNYFTGKINQAENNLAIVNNYITKLDSIGRTLNSTLTVETQSTVVNDAWALFPSSEISVMTASTPSYPNPPSRLDFMETPDSRQTAFMMVINDFIQMDRLAIFAFLLAFAIDFIVIMMAFAGSYIINDIDYLYERVKLDTAKRLKNLSLDNSSEIRDLADETLIKLNKASEFGINMIKADMSYLHKKQHTKIVLKRTQEETIRNNVRQTTLDKVLQNRISNDQRTASSNRMQTVLDSKKEKTSNVYF